MYIVRITHQFYNDTTGEFEFETKQVSYFELAPAMGDFKRFIDLNTYVSIYVECWHDRDKEGRLVASYHNYNNLLEV